MRRRWSAGIAVLTGFGLVIGLTGCAGSAPTAEAEGPTEAPQRAPVVVFLGDSYTTGVTHFPPESTYAGIAARQLGWQVILTGYGGTGYVETGRVGKNFARTYDEKLAWRPAPDMAIVSGGHNDAGVRPAEIETAARRLLARMEQRWPDTHIVVQGPIWGGNPPKRAVRAGDAIKDATRGLDLPYIDPLAGRWFTGDRDAGTGNARRYILPDDTHPTRAGHQHAARRLMAGLAKLGLEQPELGKEPDPMPATSTRTPG